MEKILREGKMCQREGGEEEKGREEEEEEEEEEAEEEIRRAEPHACIDSSSCCLLSNPHRPGRPQWFSRVFSAVSPKLFPPNSYVPCCCGAVVCSLSQPCFSPSLSALPQKPSSDWRPRTGGWGAVKPTIPLSNSQNLLVSVEVKDSDNR